MRDTFAEPKESQQAYYQQMLMNKALEKEMFMIGYGLLMYKKAKEYPTKVEIEFPSYISGKSMRQVTDIKTDYFEIPHGFIENLATSVGLRVYKKYFLRRNDVPQEAFVTVKTTPEKAGI